MTLKECRKADDDVFVRSTSSCSSSAVRQSTVYRDALTTWNRRRKLY